MNLLSFIANLFGNSGPQNVKTKQTFQGSLKDAYLTCAEYLNHPVTIEEHNIAEFKKEDRLYFVVYDNEGRVRLRSEGFDNEEAKEKELAAVIRLKDDESAYTIRQYGNKVLKILKDDTGSEIGRSCL